MRFRGLKFAGFATPKTIARVAGADTTGSARTGNAASGIAPATAAAGIPFP